MDRKNVIKQLKYKHMNKMCLEKSITYPVSRKVTAPM